jgi:hypothetical protein
MGPRRRPPSSGGASRSSSPRPGEGDGGSGRNQAIFVAAIAAVATVAAALISTFKPGDSAPPPVGQQITSPVISPRAVTPGSEDRTHQPSIEMKSVVFGQSGNARFIQARGHIDMLGSAGELYVVAAPANGEPVRASNAGVNNPAPGQSNVQRWYVSGPILISSDGSWETRIDIDPAENRDLTVEAILISFCDYLPKGDPRCEAWARTTPGSLSLNTPILPPPTPSPNRPRNTDGPDEPVPAQAPVEPAQLIHSAAVDIKHSLEQNGPESTKAKSVTATVPTHPH